MKLIFGNYSSTLKAYTPGELGLKDHSGRKETYEIMQNMMHFFFIPVFPLEKIFILRKNDEVFGVSDEIRELMLSKGKPKTPIYSFALPILLLIFLAIASITSKMRQIAELESMHKEFAEKFSHIKNDIDHTSPHNYFLLKSPKEPEWLGNYLKVIKENGDSIEFLASPKIKYFNNASNIGIANYFLMHPDSILSVTLARKELKEAIPTDYNKYHQGMYPKIHLLRNSEVFYIESSYYIDGPEISYGSAGSGGSQSQDRIQLQFVNTGFGATIKSVKNIEGKINFALESSGFVQGANSSDNKIQIIGNGPAFNEPYKFMLYLEDTLGREHQFLVRGMNFNIKVERQM